MCRPQDLCNANAFRYGSLALAASRPDGLAVMAVLFVIAAEANPHFATLLDKAAKLRRAGQKRRLRNVIPLMKLFPNQTESFLRYQGSLTTPPCSESVSWTVFTQATSVSEAQVTQGNSACSDARLSKILRASHG